MKEKTLAIVICIAILFASFGNIAAYSLQENNKSTDFDAETIERDLAECALFPSKLILIEEEAFEGTSFKSLYFPESLLRIESRAFSSVTSLVYAVIPASTGYISSDAFKNDPLVRIGGERGTYAEQWAFANGYDFIPEKAVLFDYILIVKRLLRYGKFMTSVSGLFGLAAALCVLKKKISYRHIFEFKSMRPQDRPELYPIDYRFP